MNQIDNQLIETINKLHPKAYTDELIAFLDTLVDRVKRFKDEPDYELLKSTTDFLNYYVKASSQLSSIQDVKDLIQKWMEATLICAELLHKKNRETDALRLTACVEEMVVVFREHTLYGFEHPNEYSSPKTTKSSEGCFIATACYGSYEETNVLVLRQYRDTVLMHKMLGKAFVKFYYFVSPPIAKCVAKSNFLKKTILCLLNPIVARCKDYLSKNS